MDREKMKEFYTADLHLGHANIIKYCGRPFKNINHMNKELIRRWNERVKPEDIVYHIGDFCFKNSKGGKKGEGLQTSAQEWEKKLNGKIIFIKGNHDRNNSTKTHIHSLVINIDNKLINLVHNPAHFDNRFDINFIGHVHEKWQIQRKLSAFTFVDCINVGVDVWNFYPVTYEEIIKRYKQWLKNDKVS